MHVNILLEGMQTQPLKGNYSTMMMKSQDETQPTAWRLGLAHATSNGLWHVDTVASSCNDDDDDDADLNAFEWGLWKLLQANINNSLVFYIRPICTSLSPSSRRSLNAYAWNNIPICKS